MHFSTTNKTALYLLLRDFKLGVKSTTPKAILAQKSRHYHVLFLTVSLSCVYTFPAPVSLSLLILAHLLADSESPMLCGHMIVSVRVFSVVADSVIARRAFLSLSKVCLCCRVLPFSSVTSFSFVERIPPALKSNLIQRMIRFKTTWSTKSDFSLWRSWDILFEIIKKAMILCLSLDRQNLR